MHRYMQLAGKKIRNRKCVKTKMVVSGSVLEWGYSVTVLKIYDGI